MITYDARLTHTLNRRRHAATYGHSDFKAADLLTDAAPGELLEGPEESERDARGDRRGPEVVDQAAGAALRRDHRGHGRPQAPVSCETAVLTEAEGARRGGGGGRGGGLGGGAGLRAEQVSVGWGGGQQRDMGPECRSGE
jgi:hypothetical protein